MQVQRTILWIVFSMSLLFLWDSWQRHNGKPSMFGQPTPAAQAQGDAAAPAQAPKADAGVPPAPVAAGASSAGVPAVAAASTTTPAEQMLKLGNEVLALSIDPVGGQVRRAELLRHKASLEAKGKESTNVLLLEERPGRSYVAQSGLIGAPQGAAFPTHNTKFSVVGMPAAMDGAAVLRLVAESGGLKLTRTYLLKAGSHVVEVTDDIANTGNEPLSPTLYMQLRRDGSSPEGESNFYSTYTGPVVYTDALKFQKVDFGSIEKGKPDHAKSAADGWAGIIQHYFVAAWIPEDKAQREYFARKIDTNLYAIGATQALGELAPQATKTVTSRLLIAPQDQQMLEKVAPGLDLTVDYGLLTVVAKPIFQLLEWLHSLVGNWGWAIVLLTIVIKTVFFPLQAASYKSMARMKAVTPRLTALRERYGNDRVRMNQAMMELYKEEKINPLGGCLPIVVQIPVFIALYWVLLASVEMRNAPWLGWIQDLAAPDPYYVLPLIMAGTMFLQTKLNPTPPDPVQARVMMVMPVVFSVMFFFFPSGLVLYWLVNNIYSIAQQWTIQRAFDKAAAAKKK
jgi:YidC/Oxa1 family membrane protein insertase